MIASASLTSPSSASTTTSSAVASDRNSPSPACCCTYASRSGATAPARSPTSAASARPAAASPGRRPRPSSGCADRPPAPAAGPSRSGSPGHRPETRPDGAADTPPRRTARSPPPARTPARPGWPTPGPGQGVQQLLPGGDRLLAHGRRRPAPRSGRSGPGSVGAGRDRSSRIRPASGMTSTQPPVNSRTTASAAQHVVDRARRQLGAQLLDHDQARCGSRSPHSARLRSSAASPNRSSSAATAATDGLQGGPGQVGPAQLGLGRRQSDRRPHPAVGLERPGGQPEGGGRVVEQHGIRGRQQQVDVRLTAAGVLPGGPADQVDVVGRRVRSRPARARRRVALSRLSATACSSGWEKRSSSTPSRSSLVTIWCRSSSRIASSDTTALRVSYGSGSPRASTSTASRPASVSASIRRCSSSPSRGGISAPPVHHHTPALASSRP